MKKRLDNLDLLKGISVILMSIVHVNALFFSNARGFLDILTLTGATVCFSIFLFVSGFLVGKKLKKGKTYTWKDIGKKSLRLYIYYLILGILSLLLISKDFTLQSVLRLLLISALPLYVEFLIAFIWFLIFTKLFGKIVYKYIKYWYLILIVSIAFFFVGRWLYSIPSNFILMSWLKMHTVGLNSLHTFPLLSYLPVYILGIVMSKIGSKRNYAIGAGISALLLIILNFVNIEGWYRWPPSISFILYGLLFIFVLMFAFEFVKNFKKIKCITILGKYSLQALLILTSISFLLTLLLVPHQEIWYVSLLNLAILLLSYSLLGILKKE